MKTIYKLYDLKFVSCTKKEFDNLLTNEIRDDCAYIINDEGKITIHLNSAEEKLRNWLPLHRDSGKESFAQSQDDSYTGIEIKTKNPDAYKLDNTLTDSETIGSLGDYSVSFGGNTQAKGKRAMSTGNGTLAKGNYTFASGSNSVALGLASHVEGYRNTTGPSADSAHAEGASTKALGAQSHSGGYDTVAGGDYSFVHGISSSAMGEASSAFGQNNIAGCLGFKVSNFVKGGYDAQGNPYYAKVTLNTDATNFANIAVGDKVSIRINYNSTGLLVTSVDTSTKTITLNDLLRSFPDFVASENDYLWCVEKPEAGDTPIGIGAFAGGFSGNHANQDGSFAFGRNNISDGRWATTFGSDNTAGYNTFVAGKYNKGLRSQNSAIFGNTNIATEMIEETLISGIKNTISSSKATLINGSQNNVITKIVNCLINGSDNNIDSRLVNCLINGSDNNTKLFGSTNSFLSGQGLETTRSNQTVVGMYNEDVSESALFLVGNGTSDTSRSTAFRVFPDGHAEVQKQGTTNNSVVKYSKDSLNGLINKLDTGTSAPQDSDYFISQYVGGGTTTTTYHRRPISALYDYIKGKADTTVTSTSTNLVTSKAVDNAINSKLSSVYKAKGSIVGLSSLPTPDKAHEGFVYNISEEFTTTSQFVEGTGKTYPAGTNVVCVNTTDTTYKWDTLAGMVDLSGKQDKFASYSISGTTGSLSTTAKDLKILSGSIYLKSVLNSTIIESENTEYIFGRSGLNMGNNKITELANPTADSDAANKNYIDTNFQAKLVSGTNIKSIKDDKTEAQSLLGSDSLSFKTINNQSLLGSGNITIEGGGGTTITVDAELSTTSENPVQNKVITTELNGKQPLITNTSDITLSELHAKNLYASSNILVQDIQIKRTTNGALAFSRQIGQGYGPVELANIAEGTDAHSAVNLNQLNTKQDKLTSTTDLAVRSISVSNVSTKLLQSGTDALQIVGSQIKLANNNNAAIKITNLADGTATSDAVNKGQLDTAIANKQDTFSTVTTTADETTLTADKPINITTNKYSMAYDDIKEAIKITFA